MLEKDYDLCYEKDDDCYDAEEPEKCQMIQEKGPRMLLTLTSTKGKNDCVYYFFVTGQN